MSPLPSRSYVHTYSRVLDTCHDNRVESASTVGSSSDEESDFLDNNSPSAIDQSKYHQAALSGDRTRSVCQAYVTCESIGIESLFKRLKHQSIGETTTTHQKFLGAIYSSYNNEKEVFYFANGSVVIWNNTYNHDGPEEADDYRNTSLEAISKNIKQYCFKSRSVDNILRTVEEMYYYDCTDKEVITSDGIKNDTITLSTKSHEEKLAISFAMAASVELKTFETKIDECIKVTSDIPLELASTGSVTRFSKKEISCMIGQIYVLRSEALRINLAATSKPGTFLWDNDCYESQFSDAMGYLNVEERVEALNSRLDVLKELLEMLNTEIENKHFSRLEWIVIWLILVEVLVQVVWEVIIKDIFKLV